MRKNWGYIVISIIFFVMAICSFCFSQWFDCCKNELNILGALSSIFGIIIVVIQLRHAVSIAEATADKTEIINQQANIIANHAEETKNAIDKSLNRTSRIITIAEASQIVHLPNEIQDALQNNDLGRAYEKMRNLKDALVELKSAPQFQEAAVSEELSALISDLTIRLTAISKAIKDRRETMFAQNKTIELMEETRTFLKYQSTIMRRQNLE